MGPYQSCLCSHTLTQGQNVHSHSKNTDAEWITPPHHLSTLEIFLSEAWSLRAVGIVQILHIIGPINVQHYSLGC